jgi:hypothetical protein
VLFARGKHGGNFGYASVLPEGLLPPPALVSIERQILIQVETGIYRYEDESFKDWVLTESVGDQDRTAH